MKKIDILIVEDELIVAKYIEVTLTGLGYSISGIVSSGSDAVNHVKKTNPILC